MLVKRATGGNKVTTLQFLWMLNDIIKGFCYRKLMPFTHYNDIIMSAMASQITTLMIVYSTVYSGRDQRKHQSSASLAFVRGIHRWLVNSPHKWPVTQNMLSSCILSNAVCHQIPLNIIIILGVGYLGYSHSNMWFAFKVIDSKMQKRGGGMVQDCWGGDFIRT